MEKTKVAIIGSREYTNKIKVQEFVHQLKLNSDGSTTFAGKVSTYGESTDFHANA